MNDELTRHVLAVIDSGLKLKERLSSGEYLLLDTENAKLKQMLWGEGAVSGHPDYGENLPRPVLPENKEFLGIRYALACWIDELMIEDPNSPWREEWKERALESAIYGGSQERAWRFWVQAGLAEKRPGAEALEAYLWCFMLGFRGDPDSPYARIDPVKWAEGVRRRVLAARQQEARLPADLNLRTNVPALRGRDRFRTAARVMVVVAAIGLFAATTAITGILAK